jgi:hypothetical protein
MNRLMQITSELSWLEVVNATILVILVNLVSRVFGSY